MKEILEDIKDAENSARAMVEEAEREARSILAEATAKLKN